jgi:putative transposase
MHAARLFANMDCVLLACNGEAHLQLLIEHPPKLLVSALVNAFKGTSSRGLRKARSDIAAHGVLWSPSYFAASTGGTPREKDKRYLHQQRASSSP